ncbi:MATE family efflux transporter [Clostridium sp. YIM B02551]|uniref:MATE family efflux transporter n=1 Tax=Clostridium sp. YIM B02551 TaxID=2910679 RepID=UPI001EECB56B
MMINKSSIKEVLSLALPAVGEMILYMMIWVFDTMMVGKYGGNLSVSSVGLSSEIITTFSNILIASGISIGITSLVARSIGAKKSERAEQYASIGFLLTLIIGFFLSLIFFFFSKEILTLAGGNNDVVSLGTGYMKIASIGIFFSMSMNALNGALRGSGNTKIPLIASIIINIINISLDYILIWGRFGLPELGINGAATATCIAQIVGFVFIFVYVFKFSKIRPRFKYIVELQGTKLSSLVRLSIPSALQESAFSISRLLSNIFIISLGTISFASNQIATTIESISFMPGWGFAVAATTLVGHKIGEGNYKKAKEYANTSIFLGVIIMLFCSLLFLVIPNTLINLFITSSEREVITLGTYCLMIASIEQPFMGISMIVGGALKGIGDTKTPFKVAMFSSWIIRLPLMYAAIYVFRLPVTFVWIITSIQWAIDGTLVYTLYKRKFNKLYS